MVKTIGSRNKMPKFTSQLHQLIIQLSNLGKLLLTFIFLVCKVERIIIL